MYSLVQLGMLINPLGLSTDIDNSSLLIFFLKQQNLNEKWALNFLDLVTFCEINLLAGTISLEDNW